MIPKRFILEASVVGALLAIWCVALWLVRPWLWIDAGTGALSILLWVGLGLQRRGGLYLTTDSLLWCIALATLSPYMLFYGDLTTPIFVAMLVAFRAYMQWPGVGPAITIGLLLGLLCAIDIQFIWVIAVLAPSIFIGVGWRRTYLYWRWGHCISFIAVFGLIIAALIYLDHTPHLPDIPESILDVILHRTIILCLNGLGLIAAVFVLCWSFLKSNRHFARVLALSFLVCLWASIFFKDGGPFCVPVGILALVLLGFVIGLFNKSEVRWVIGHLCLLLILALSWQMFRKIKKTPDLVKARYTLAPFISSFKEARK